MDLQRLKELEKLAGLRFDAEERAGLLDDLIQLEKFASRLPKVPAAETDQGVAENRTSRSLVSLPMDRHLEETNAPAREDGFYVIPPPNRPSGGESS